MPSDANFKKVVRARMRVTGERYTQARSVLRPVMGGSGTPEMERPDVQFRVWPDPRDLRQAGDLLDAFTAHSRGHVDDGSAIRSAIDRLLDAPQCVHDALVRAWDYQVAARPDTKISPIVTATVSLAEPPEQGGRVVPAWTYGTGDVWVGCWPTQENVALIGSCAVFAFAHLLRGANVGDGQGTAEWVIANAIAEVFTAAVMGDEPIYTCYVRVPDEEVDEAVPRIVDALLGDTPLEPGVLGDPADGPWPRLGFTAGRRLVEAYIHAREVSPADTMFVPARDIVRAAKPD